MDEDTMFFDLSVVENVCDAGPRVNHAVLKITEAESRRGDRRT